MVLQWNRPQESLHLAGIEKSIYIYISSSHGSHAWLWILLVSTFPNESLMYHRSLYNNNIMCDNKHSVNANIIQD